MYWVDALNQVLIFAVLAMSLNLLLGYAGQMSVAHAAFAAIGGYCVGYLTTESGMSLALAVLIGVGGALLIGMLISLPALLLSEDYVILLTLATQTIILVMITSIGALGGLFGLTGLPAAEFFGKELISPSDWLWPLVIINVVIFGLLAGIGASPFGRVLRGIREDQLATQSLGKDVWLKKVAVFGLTSAIAAVGGILLATYNGIVAPGLYSFDQSILIIAMVVLGGRGNLLGSVLGALVVIGSGPVLQKLIQMSPEDAALVRLILFGVLLIVVLMVRPQGILPETMTLGRVRRALRGANGMPKEDLTVAEIAGEVAEQAGTHSVVDPQSVLNVAEISKTFGGIKAVDGLSFDLKEGRVTGLIGPNGAGKTTVFNLLTGAINPDHGTVTYEDEDITGWPIDRVARSGMVRSFQDVRIFPKMTVLDNVVMAVPGQRGESAWGLLTPWRVTRDQRRVKELARHQLQFVGLLDRQYDVAEKLPFGAQKLLALARILATDARVLLLDEPTSGMDSAWVDRMVEMIGRLRDNGLTVCIVEHNLNVVERLSDHVYFMEAGRISAEGSMSELAANPRLTEVYFGKQ